MRNVECGRGGEERRRFEKIGRVISKVLYNLRSFEQREVESFADARIDGARRQEVVRFNGDRELGVEP